MKKFVLSALILLAVALSVQPAFAEEHTHDGSNTAQAAQDDAAAPSETMCDHENMLQESLQKMRAQMAQISHTKDPKKRQKLLQEHSKSMRASMKILREMMAGMPMGPAPRGAISGRMMDGNKAGDRMMGGNMAGMKCDHMKSEPSASQPEGNADDAAVARSNPDQAAASGNAPADPARKLWLCPMHPDEVQDHPGVCRICGMDLLSKEELEAPFPGQDTAKDTMKCDHMKGDMKDCCMSGGGKKCDHNRMGAGMKCDHRMGGMKGGYMGGSGMKCDHRMGKPGRHMNAILVIMEQMLEHNEAAMATRK